MRFSVKINEIQPAFNNAHRALWATKNPERKILRGHDSFLVQGRWWMEEHDVLLYGSGINNWTHAEFPSKEYLTWFVMRWS